MPRNVSRYSILASRSCTQSEGAVRCVLPSLSSAMWSRELRSTLDKVLLVIIANVLLSHCSTDVSSACDLE